MHRDHRSDLSDHALQYTSLPVDATLAGRSENVSVTLLTEVGFFILVGML
jgi:hypothetical protein